METRHITIMLTDIKGFTSKTASFSRAETQELLTKHRELVLPVIEKFHGRLVKTIGDAFLVAFNSPTDAVLCGVEVQTVLRSHNADKPQDEKIEIRIAINAGEVAIHDDGDIYGDAVNITSRLESIAEPGEVFFTESVYLAMNKKEVPSSEIGYRQFKGIPEKIKVFRVLRETPVGAQPAGVAAVAAEQTAAAPAAGQTLPGRTRAGFWRRFTSLLVDICIFAIAMNILGLQACGPNAKVETKLEASDKPEVRNIPAGKVDIKSGSITIKGDNGEVVSIDKNGVKVNEPGRPDGKYSKRTSVGFATGDTDKKRVPLKMFIWALYCAIMIWRFGATPGMMVLKLKAVEDAAGMPVPADKAFLRSFFSLVSFGAAGLGYAWALWEKDKRTWHDIIAGTRIVKI
ncbi:MAG: hypothetical protein A2081_02830 [Elusimicrobia bacterium GWC2_61_19]|nr:MAG: hypothetical protein A2081_02830 [Elusimicrobia bacterium GWC2_61_19]